MLPLLKNNYNGKNKSLNDELTLNILTAYNYFKKDKVYEALKYQILNEKKLDKNEDSKLQLSNKIIAALIYEEEDAFGMAGTALQNAKGETVIENYQIEAYKAYLKLKDEKYSESRVYFENALSDAKAISLLDYFYCLLNLSKICNELALNNEQLLYATKADSLINSGTENFFNKAIDYNISQSSISKVSASLKNQSLINLSTAYRRNKQYSSALRVLNRLIAIEKNNKASTTLTDIYINKALTYTFLKDYSNASSAYYEALKFEDSEQDRARESEIYNLLLSGLNWQA